jgi:hypothetical protein
MGSLRLEKLCRFFEKFYAVISVNSVVGIEMTANLSGCFPKPIPLA